MRKNWHKEFDLKKMKNIISLGHFCGIAEDLETLGYRNASYPFDWVISDFSGVLELMNNSFENFLSSYFLKQSNLRRERYLNQYKIEFFHDFDKYRSLGDQISETSEKYSRTIQRFFETIVDPTLFIRYIENDDEYDFILNDKTKIREFFKKFNIDNQIIFIYHKNEGLEDIFLAIDNDKNDDVCRHPLLKLANEDFFIKYNFPIEKIKRNLKIARKKNRFKIVHHYLNKIKDYFNRVFKKEYVHNSIY